MSAVVGQMVEVEIDGKKVEVAPGAMVMEAASKAGVFIPHFCYHKKLSIAANCRMCLVEVEKAPKPLPACATPCTPGMIVRTHSDKAVAAQKSVMEFLLINHPLDCPICDQGGECQLQDLAVGYGGTQSVYQEEKRVVFHKNVGPLISMEEMTRCIHCTRCVRFGQEVAGIMELGMAHRGEHSEIQTFVGRSVDSEVSGNMIDLCPVGALTSKPFRYSARTWELARRRSVSPHDSLGANLVVQVKKDRVLRVVPYENEAINECWLSDKDRFSYEALNSDARLTRPMIRQGGALKEVDWQTALEFVANGLGSIKRDHGANAVGALASPNATLEELYLFQKLMRGLGIENVDARLRMSDFEFDARRSGAPLGSAPWLGMPIADVSTLNRALLIGSSLRKEQPLLAVRMRQAARRGLKLHVLHALDDDLLMTVASKRIVAPSQWHAVLNEIVVAVAQAKTVAVPEELASVVPGQYAQTVAASLLSGERKAIFLGASALAHPQATRIAASAQWIARETGAVLGVLPEAANSVGAYWAGAVARTGENAARMLTVAKRAYVLLGVEPELDCHNGAAARAAMDQADFVVALSPFKTAALDYAHALLPIAPFTETPGTFVNAAGTVQSFHAVVKPLGETRPGWKVLRVLGNLLQVPGFEHESAAAVCEEALRATDAATRLNNLLEAPVTAAVVVAGLALERIAPVPIYHADALVRRAPSLQATADAQTPKAVVHPAVLDRLGLRVGDAVRVKQGASAISLVAAADASLPESAVRIAAAHPATAGLGAMYGEITLERA